MMLMRISTRAWLYPIRDGMKKPFPRMSKSFVLSLRILLGTTTKAMRWLASIVMRKLSACTSTFFILIPANDGSIRASVMHSEAWAEKQRLNALTNKHVVLFPKTLNNSFHLLDRGDIFAFLY